MTALPRDRRTTLDVVLFSGDRVRFRRMELPRGLLHRYALVLYSGFAVILSQVPMFNETLDMNLLERLGITVLAVAVAVLSALLWFWLAELRQPPGTRREMRVSPVLFVLSGLSTVAIVYLAYVVPGHRYPRPLHFIAIWFWFFLLAQIFTHYFLLVLMRRVLLDMRKSDPEEVALDPGAATVLDIKGVQVPLAALCRVAAEGNYIRVVTDGGQHFLPGPFGPVAEALPPGLGMRVSRSDWVARGAITRAYRHGRDLTLDLVDGSAVRVAQARRKAVLDWLEGAAQGAAEGVSEGASGGVSGGAAGAPAGRAMSTQTGAWREAVASAAAKGSSAGGQSTPEAMTARSRDGRT